MGRKPVRARIVGRHWRAGCGAGGGDNIQHTFAKCEERGEIVGMLFHVVNHLLAVGVVLTLVATQLVSQCAEEAVAIPVVITTPSV